MPPEVVIGSVDTQENRPHTIQTTLYDLINDLHDAAQPGEEDLIVPTVMQWLRTGRITWRKQRQQRQEELTRRSAKMAD